MKKVTLKEYLEAASQKALAAKVGLTQAAISRMFRENRNVFVITRDDGTVQLREEKIIAQKSA